MNLYKLSIAADIGDDQVTIFQGEVPVRYDAYWSKPNHTCNLFNKYVQRKKWWVKIPTKFNWEKNNEIVSPIRTTKFGKCSG